MIILLEKPIEELKFGIFGSRYQLFERPLQDLDLDYHILQDLDQLDHSFDIVFGSGFYRILPDEYLSTPKYGLIFFHETPLPEGRGNAPVQWTVKHSRPNLTITAFQATAEIDAGKYLYQYNVPINQTDTLDILNQKREEGVRSCCKAILVEMKQGALVLREQTGRASVNPRRTPSDSELDPTRSLRDLWDEIRVCDNEKFPAFFFLEDKKIILKYEVRDKEDC